MKKYLAITTAVIFLTIFFLFAPNKKVSSSPLEITQSFYDSFMSCSKNPPKAADGMVTNYCQINTGYTSEKFAQNIKSSPGADSTTCSQNPPTSIQATTEKIEDNKASVSVDENFGGTISETIIVELVLNNNQWQINNIICPDPN